MKGSSGKPAKSMFSAEASLPNLKAISVTTQKEAVRFAVSALVRSGIAPVDIRTLRDVCKPESFERALDQLAIQLKGPTVTVKNVAVVLAKIGRHSGALTGLEIERIGRSLDAVRRQVAHYKRNREDRDQKLLDQLDANPSYLDALLALPTRTVRRVVRSGRKTYRDALAVQFALILELWLCTSLRLKNMRHLQLDRHFFRVTLNDLDHVVIRVPAMEVKNGKALEHFLNGDTVNLLQLYLDEFLPILTRHNPSTYLFPGQNGRPKSPQALGPQMNRFVRDGTGLDFHPHAIRKITTKICLDNDPGDIEVARRNLGDTEDTTRSVYAQRVNRASQQKYVEALEKRRLTAFSSFARIRPRRK